MHLVSEFSTYDQEDKQWAEYSAHKLVKEESLSPEEAQEAIKRGQSQVLQFRHKVQVLEAYFQQKLTNKYTMEHVKFMFQQQLPYLK